MDPVPAVPPVINVPESRQRVGHVRMSHEGSPNTPIPHDHSETPQVAAVDMVHAMLAATTYSATAPSVPG
jgi:hypothetical protein